MERSEMSELPTRDCRELDAFRKQECLASYATNIILTLAPILRLSQLSNIDTAIGTTSNIDISEVTRISDKILRVKISVNIKKAFNVEKQSHVLYTFRSLSIFPIEPFLCITQESSRQVVTAFESNREYIQCSINGDEANIFKELKITAEKKGMRALLRFIDLIRQKILLEEV